MKCVSDLYFAGYELCSTEEHNTITININDDRKNVKKKNKTQGNKIIIKSLHNSDYTIYLSPEWDRKEEIQDNFGECKKITKGEIISSESTNSSNSVSNEIISMTNVNVDDIDICYVYDECELLLEDEYKKDEKEGEDCKEEEFAELWIHGCDLERLQSSYGEHNTKSKHKDTIDVENMPEKLILLGYTYGNGISTEKCNTTYDNATLLYLLSVTPNNQPEIWECTSLEFVRHHYRTVASMEKEAVLITTYSELQEFIHNNNTNNISITSSSRACRLPVMWRGAESSIHDTHSSLWYSPVLEQVSLSEVYQVSVEKIYYLGKWQKYIRFVGVSCAVPWVCDVTNLSKNTFTSIHDDNAERIIFARPLSNCYSYETLLREYEMSDGEKKIIQNVKEEQHEEQEQKEKQQTLLGAREVCTECDWALHFAKCVQIRRNMAIVKGDYGVILSCEITSLMLSRLKLSCKDRLVCLPETGTQCHEQTEHKHINNKTEKLTWTKCTVVGTCGEHLVVLYDDRDTVHLIREFPLRTETDVALHFVHESKIDQEEEEESKEEEDEDKINSGSDIDSLERSETVNSVIETNVETHKDECKVGHATEFTDFLIAHAVSELQAQSSNIDNSIDNVSSDKVFEYYYNSTNTFEKMMNALHAYQENNLSR